MEIKKWDDHSSHFFFFHLSNMNQAQELSFILQIENDFL